jgi:hypothetical protein
VTFDKSIGIGIGFAIALFKGDILLVKLFSFPSVQPLSFALLFRH